MYVGRHRVQYPKVDYRLRVLFCALAVAIALSASVGTVSVAVSSGTMPPPIDTYVYELAPIRHS